MNQNIGEIIKRLRQENHMTQEQLAEKADICVAYISKIENNHTSNITLSVACDLAQVFHVSVSYLLGELDESAAMDREIAMKLASCTPEEKRMFMGILEVIIENRYRDSDKEKENRETEGAL